MALSPIPVPLFVTLRSSRCFVSSQNQNWSTASVVVVYWCKRSKESDILKREIRPLYSKIFFCGARAEATSKSDGIRRLKPIGDSFKSQPKYFCKYVPLFRRMDRTMWLKLGKLVMALINITFVQGSLLSSYHYQFASLHPVPPPDHMVSLHTSWTKFVVLDDITGFVIQRCSEVFFCTGSTLNLSQQHFPVLWKQPPTVRAFKNVTLPLLPIKTHFYF